MKKRTLGLAFGSFFLLCTADAKTPVRQPTLVDLGTVWVGGTTGASLEFLRLSLDSQGKGLLTVQYLPTIPAVAYRVVRTTLVKYDVAFETEAIDASASPIYLRGIATPGHLELVIGNSELKWKRPVALQPHADLMAKLRAVTERALDLEKERGQH